jgi:membrane-bound lytic murein transglycosylase A
MNRIAFGLLLLLASCTQRQAAPTVVTQPIPPAEAGDMEPLPDIAPSEPGPALDTTGSDTLSLTKVAFAKLPGWRQDKQGEAIVAFSASCEKLAELDNTDPVGTGPYGGHASHWRKACAAVKKITKSEHKKARAFFEQHFHAYAAEGNAGSEGRITGYYVQPLRASRKRGGRYQFPLYKRPDDLVAVKLDDFVEDGRSRRVWGRIDPKSGRLLPYPTRREYEQEIQAARNDAVLLWLDSPADTVLVEIEGSGRATLDDGSVVMVAFDGKNGRKSQKRGVAKALRAFETKHGKRRWTKAAIARVAKIAKQKDSMVFFEIEHRSGAIGSQNVVLTPKRSLAVDRAIVPLSTPIWVDTKAPKSAKSQHATWRRLLIAQDTGGAILGTIRGDIYFGDDAEAVAIGRRVNGAGRMWLLLPKTLPAPVM